MRSAARRRMLCWVNAPAGPEEGASAAFLGRQAPPPLSALGRSSAGGVGARRLHAASRSAAAAAAGAASPRRAAGTNLLPALHGANYLLIGFHSKHKQSLLQPLGAEYCSYCRRRLRCSCPARECSDQIEGCQLKMPGAIEGSALCCSAGAADVASEPWRVVGTHGRARVAFGGPRGALQQPLPVLCRLHSSHVHSERWVLSPHKTEPV